MSYDHASELSNSQPPLAQHKFLVAELGSWAKLNPALVSLWAEFQRVHKLLSGET